jgi:hypothetical protein
MKEFECPKDCRDINDCPFVDEEGRECKYRCPKRIEVLPREGK